MSIPQRPERNDTRWLRKRKRRAPPATPHHGPRAHVRFEVSRQEQGIVAHEFDRGPDGWLTLSRVPTMPTALGTGGSLRVLPALARAVSGDEGCAGWKGGRRDAA